MKNKIKFAIIFAILLIIPGLSVNVTAGTHWEYKGWIKNFYSDNMILDPFTGNAVNVEYSWRNEDTGETDCGKYVNNELLTFDSFSISIFRYIILYLFGLPLRFSMYIDGEYYAE